MTTEIEEFAPAKINLSLHVTGRRKNGFHELESLVIFADRGDLITVRPAARLGLSLSGPAAAGLREDKDNLVMRAARALAAHAGIAAGAEIHLEKNLPIASGIGGGSADAAAALRALMRLWDLQLPPRALQEIALSLGADVPACLISQPLMMGGIGEQLQPVAQFPALDLVLANPGAALSTPAVFRALDWQRPGPDRPPLPCPCTAAAAADWLENTGNDLQAPAAGLAPQITQTLVALQRQPGCTLARMSGSGATCFGIFTGPDKADEAAEQLSQHNPSWWVRPACGGGINA